MSEHDDEFGLDVDSVPPVAPDLTLPEPTESNDDADVVPEGTVLVATRRGYKFVLPGVDNGEDYVFTTKPVPVPEDKVEWLIKASSGRLYEVDPKTDNDDEEV